MENITIHVGGSYDNILSFILNYSFILFTQRECQHKWMFNLSFYLNNTFTRFLFFFLLYDHIFTQSQTLELNMDTVVELIIMRWMKFCFKKTVVKNYKSYVFNVQNINGWLFFGKWPHFIPMIISIGFIQQPAIKKEPK